MPKTFSPKDDGFTAKQKKLSFLSSDVLPRTQYPPSSGLSPLSPSARASELYIDPESDERIDPKMRRQQEQSSDLFGRETPQATQDQLYDSSRRLTPNDFKWFNIPVKSAQGGGEMTHSDRHYNEKCSQLFEHQSPHARYAQGLQQDDRLAREEDMAGEKMRRSNVYYSDLFGRSTPMELPEEGDGGYRPKSQCRPEDRIVVHQDWTDSKTELVCGSKAARSDCSDTPNMRKANELHQARIFGDHGHGGYVQSEAREPVTTDNSHKVKNVVGMHTQHIHQAHLRTSLTAPEFYEEAELTRHWEVVELHISGLPYDADESQMRRLCNGFDLQIVKISVETDPVRNLCKGRAKIMVRYNPKRDSVAGLVQRFEAANLMVEV